jgi:hypothetical protein
MWLGRKRRGEAMLLVPWREPARAASTAAAMRRSRARATAVPLSPPHAASSSSATTARSLHSATKVCSDQSFAVVLYHTCLVSSARGKTSGLCLSETRARQSVAPGSGRLHFNSSAVHQHACRALVREGSARMGC